MPYAVGLGLKTSFGTFYTLNITPNKETGIGYWADEQFINARHNGITPHGKNYFPIFPYTPFPRIIDKAPRY